MPKLFKLTNPWPSPVVSVLPRLTTHLFLSWPTRWRQWLTSLTTFQRVLSLNTSLPLISWVCLSRTNALWSCDSSLPTIQWPLRSSVSIGSHLKIWNYFQISTSSSASFPTFMWGRCFLWDAPIELGLELPPLTILSLTRHSWCYPTTFGLPLLLFPSTTIPITPLPTYSSSLLETCPCLLSCTFLDISPTFVVPLILSFLILSSLMTPLIHLNILISATSNFFSCAFFTAHVSVPYIIAGPTTFLYTSPWLSNLFFGLTESLIPSSCLSILIVFYASSPHPSLHSLPMSLLDI